MILRSKSESEVRCWCANINKSHSWIYEKMWFIKIPQNLCKQKFFFTYSEKSICWSREI